MFGINPETLETTIPILLKGMGGIFVVTIIIIAAVKLLTAIFPEK